MSQIGQVAAGTVRTGGDGVPSAARARRPSTDHPVRVPNASFRDIGIFVQDEWNVSPARPADRRASRGRLPRDDRSDAGLRRDARSSPAPQPPIDPATLPDVNGDRISRTARHGRSRRDRSGRDRPVRRSRTTCTAIAIRISRSCCSPVRRRPATSCQTSRSSPRPATTWTSARAFACRASPDRSRTSTTRTAISSRPRSWPISPPDELGLAGDQSGEGAHPGHRGARPTSRSSPAGSIWLPHATVAFNARHRARRHDPVSGESLAGEPQDNITPLKIVGGLCASATGAIAGGRPTTSRIEAEVTRVSPLCPSRRSSSRRICSALDGLRRAARWRSATTGARAASGSGITLAVDNLDRTRSIASSSSSRRRAGRSVTMALTVDGREVGTGRDLRELAVTPMRHSYGRLRTGWGPACRGLRPACPCDVWTVIAVLILANALYVAAEFAAVGVRRSRVRRLAEDGNWLAARLLPFVETPAALDRYVGASQIGITLSSLDARRLRAGDHRVAARAVRRRWLRARTADRALDCGHRRARAVLTGAAARHRRARAEGARAAVSDGDRARDRAADARGRSRLFRPFIALLNGTRHRWSCGCSAPEHGHRHLHSPEEIELLIAESRDGGLLEPDEQQRLRRALHLGLRTARDLMVPREQLTMLELARRWEDVVRIVAASPFSRLPVYRGSTGRDLGTLRVKDLVDRYVRRGSAAARAADAARRCGCPTTCRPIRCIAPAPRTRVHQASWSTSDGRASASSPFRTCSANCSARRPRRPERGRRHDARDRAPDQPRSSCS